MSQTAKCRLVLLLRVVLGVVFIFSGVVKAVEPYGTSLKVAEWLGALGLDMFASASGVAAVVLASGECALGAALVLGAWPRVVAWATLAVNTIFMLLTLWLAVANPIADCGCFGDVVVLTNWQTFYKNIALVVLSVLLVGATARRQQGCWRGYGAVATFIVVAALSAHWLVGLPPVERFPFGVGVDVAEAIAEEEAAEMAAAQGRVVCRNRLSGLEQEFLASDATWWNDQEWEWVRNVEQAATDVVRVRATDFILWDRWGGEATEEILATEGEVAMVLIQRTAQMNDRLLGRVAEEVERAAAEGHRVLIVTASDLDRSLVVLERGGVDMLLAEIYNMDITTMQALLRNPSGVVTLHDGVVVAKRPL